MRGPWSFLGTLSLVLVACRGGSDPETPEQPGGEELRRRAEFDLGCKQLSFVQISEKTIGVRGCGKKVVYVESCQNPHIPWDCNWILNSDERRTSD